MTLDPTFDFNGQMGDQSLERRATLNAACGDNGTEWTLTLGSGTGRDGELVIDAISDIPFGPLPVEVNDQAATFTIERTTAAALPDVTSQNTFGVVAINIDDAGSDTPPVNVGGDTDETPSISGGSGALSWYLALLVLMPLCRYRWRQRRCALR